MRDAYWSADGREVYYSAKRSGSPIVDLHRIGLADRKDHIVDPMTMAGADAAAVFDRAGKRAAFARNGDIFVRELASGRLQQITRTPQTEAAPQFSDDGRLLSFRVDHDWFVRQILKGTSVTTPAAVVKTEKGSGCAAQTRRFAGRAVAHVLDLEETARRGGDKQKACRGFAQGRCDARGRAVLSR